MMNDSLKAVFVVYAKDGVEMPRKVDITLALEKLKKQSGGKFDFAVPFSSDGTWILEVKL